MDNFLDKLNQDLNLDTGLSVTKPFIGDPNLLSLPVREELIYRYQFLEESIPTLARTFRVTPNALQQFFDINNIKPQVLDTPEQMSAFESHVNETYKEIRLRLSGLISIQTANAWAYLQKSENYLLETLTKASKSVYEKSVSGFVDAQELKRLVDTHAKIVDRQQLIQDALKAPALADLENLADTLTKTLTDLLDEIDDEGRNGYSDPGQAS